MAGIQEKKIVNVLLIENDPTDADFISKHLANADNVSFQLVRADRLASGIERLAQGAIQAILLNLSLPDSRGMETFTKLASHSDGVPIIILSDVDDQRLAIEAVQSGAQDYLVKGEVVGRMLTRTVLSSIERHRIKSELNVISTGLRELNKQLRTTAYTDPVTELLNRQGLQQVITREMAWARREGTGFVMILIDLDDFKKVNTEFGHLIGDTVLSEVGLRIRHRLRSTDYLARLGGDEFVVLMPQTRLAEGMRVAEGLRQTVSKTPILFSQGTVRVTASLGVITVSEEDLSTIDNMLAKTHLLLYKSKRLGKNRISSSQEGSKKYQDPKQPLSRIIRSVESGQTVRSVKQTIRQLQTGEVIGHEFLSRFEISGYEMPDDFFRICLETGALTAVDFSCFKTCAEGALATAPKYQCFLNLFPSTITSVPIEQFIEVLQKGQKRPMKNFCVEISEQQIVGDPSYLAGAVKKFQQAGVRVAIDDVGFGRSCIESLIFLSPDIVKIDKRFVGGIAKDEGKARLLRRLLNVVDALKIETIAEGIEVQSDLDVLKDFGVKFGQGFLWGKPA